MPTNTLAAEDDGVGEGLNVAGFDANYDGTDTSYENVIKLVYDDDSEAFASGAINGQFLGVSAADSGNADQPRAIIGTWNIGERSYGSNDGDTTGTTTTTTLGDRADAPDGGSTLDGVYGADLVVP